MKQTIFLPTRALPTGQNARQAHPNLQQESYIELHTTAAFSQLQVAHNKTSSKHNIAQYQKNRKYNLIHSTQT